MQYVQANKDLLIYPFAAAKLQPNQNVKDVIPFLTDDQIKAGGLTFIKGAVNSKPLQDKFTDSKGRKWLILAAYTDANKTTPMILYTSDSDYTLQGSALSQDEKSEVEKQEAKKFFSTANMKSLVQWLVIILALVYLANTYIKK